MIIIGNAKFIMEGVVDMEQTFYVGMKICDYYAVYINDDGYEKRKWFKKTRLMDLYIV